MIAAESRTVRDAAGLAAALVVRELDAAILRFRRKRTDRQNAR